MEKKTARLTGELYIFQASSEEEFSQLIDDELIPAIELEKAFFIETDTLALFEFKCDIPGTKDYIKAFIYEDGKVLGKYYFATLQGFEPVELNAWYSDDAEGYFEIWGSIYVKEVQYFFEFVMVKAKVID
jgi:hypothetical protein